MKIKLIAILFLVSIFIAGCKESSDSDPTKFSVRLTDNPAEYEAVNVDIQSIKIHVSASDVDDEDNGWIELANIEKGVYNLLDYTDGKSVEIANDELELSTISQIRLVLGENNTIVVDGEEKPLDTPSAQQSGLKLKFNGKLEAGVPYTIWLDFDAEKSVVEKGNGTYSLKPVIKVLYELNQENENSEGDGS